MLIWGGFVSCLQQKVVIKVAMNGQKSRTKALKIAVGVSGVESAALKGQEKDEIEVTGEEIDVVALTFLLRKNVGNAEVVCVGAAEKKEQKKEEKKEEQKNEPTVHAWHSYPYEIGVTHYPIYHYPEYTDRPDSCPIM